jgi:hypothetical protein
MLRKFWKKDWRIVQGSGLRVDDGEGFNDESSKGFIFN